MRFVIAMSAGCKLRNVRGLLMHVRALDIVDRWVATKLSTMTFLRSCFLLSRLFTDQFPISEVGCTRG